MGLKLLGGRVEDPPAAFRVGEFVSKGTEISLGKFVTEHLTPLTLDIKTRVVSDEDTGEIWEIVKEVAIEKVRRNKKRASGGDSPFGGR